MSRNPSDQLTPEEVKRLDSFIDCVAHLLAKRWLRDQRAEERKPANQERQAPDQEE